jgi:hypothetical protein
MEKICKRVCGYLVAAILMCVGMVSTAVALSVEYKLSDPTIMAGSTFDLDIIVDGAVFPDVILSFGFDVEVDPSEFDYLGASVGPNFDEPLSPLPNTDVAGSAFPAASGDDILLASLTFEALLGGDYSIWVISDLTDLNEGLRTLSPQRIDLTQKVDVSVAAAPVPEPGTLLLMLAGIGGLGFLKRRRS